MMSDKPLTDITFSSFGSGEDGTQALHPALLAGLDAAGFTRCTPIQALTLPVALAGRDVAGQAQTGTGKTLAFLVTVVNRLLSRPALAERKPEDPRALILAPTRELAIQIHKDAVKFCSDLGLKFALVYGGVDYDKQRALLQAGADVIIATPGRLIDYVKQHKVVSLHACEVCVLDEADRMFDLGFIKDIRFLLRRMPERTTRQTLLFSATLSHRVLELAYEHMNEPEKLVVEAEFITAAKVRQKIYYPADDEKIPLLLGLLSRSEGARTMVFVNTKAFVERVARALDRAGYRVGVLSGDVPQKKRESLLKKFQAGQLELLVATDVAARGLHIDGVSHVYNYDLPFDAEDYVHRIGRTARLGAEGDAISFACERYAMSLPDIERYIDQKIPSEPVTRELLTALPRPERVRPAAEGEGEGGEDEDLSLGTIFREAREQRAADDARHGRGGRPGAGGRGGRGESGGRGGPPRGDGEGRRRPRREEDSTAPAAAQAAGAAELGAVTPTDGRPQPVEGGERRRRRRGGRGEEGGTGAGAAQAASPAGHAPAVASGSGEAGESDRAPRKRRRRRGGKRIDGGEGAQQVGQAVRALETPPAVAVPAASGTAPKAAEESPSLFKRIGSKLKSLVTRAPSSRH